jgi:hypothetical protein
MHGLYDLERWWLGACVNGKGLGFALVFEDWTVCTVARPIGLL